MRTKRRRNQCGGGCAARGHLVSLWILPLRVAQMKMCCCKIQILFCHSHWGVHYNLTGVCKEISSFLLCLRAGSRPCFEDMLPSLSHGWEMTDKPGEGKLLALVVCYPLDAVPACHALYLSPIKSPKWRSGPPTWLLLIPPSAPRPPASAGPSLSTHTRPSELVLHTCEHGSSALPVLRASLVSGKTLQNSTSELRVRHTRRPPSWSHEPLCISCPLFKRHVTTYSDSAHARLPRRYTHIPHFPKPTPTDVQRCKDLRDLPAKLSCAGFHHSNVVFIHAWGKFAMH